MLWAIIMAMNPKKKERTIKDDWCDLAKDPLIVKSVIFLGHKDRK